MGTQLDRVGFNVVDDGRDAGHPHRHHPPRALTLNSMDAPPSRGQPQGLADTKSSVRQRLLVSTTPNQVWRRLLVFTTPNQVQRCALAGSDGRRRAHHGWCDR